VSSSRLLSLEAFSVQLDVDVQRARRYRRALSVGLIALDGVRALGAEHGTAARERILAAVGHSIANAVRGSDLACRTVGGEFVVLFAETRAEQAARATQRVVAGLEDVRIEGVRGLRAVAAVAELDGNEDPEALLARARRALASPGPGRDRVVVAPQQRSTGR
jgi:diguanylate cyclase (GGDEF)-like protein